MPRPPNPIDSHGAPGVISEHELYTREELSRRLGLGSAALRSMRREGIPLVRKSGRLYFVGRHVIAWFAAASKPEGQPDLKPVLAASPAPALGTSRTNARHRQGQSPRDVRGFFAERIGAHRDDLPVLTHGELMRIANCDIVTMHNWLYFGEDLPESAIELLQVVYAAAVNAKVAGSSRTSRGSDSE